MTKQQIKKYRNSLLVEIAAGIAISLIAGAAGYALHPVPARETPHEAVWIEFENLQHAIEAASKLGGAARGLTVCMRKTEEQPYTVWNPGVSVTGDLRDCAFRKGGQRTMMEISSSGATPVSISSLTFDGERSTIGMGFIRVP